jgi:hypothetical protein
MTSRWRATRKRLKEEKEKQEGGHSITMHSVAAYAINTWAKGLFYSQSSSKTL